MRPDGLRQWHRAKRMARGGSPSGPRAGPTGLTVSRPWHTADILRLQAKYIGHVAKTGQGAKSAEAASEPQFRLTLKRVAGWLKEDLAFRERYLDARLLFGEMLEEEALRRAVAGVEKDVWFKGEVVGAERQYSDQLLIVLLKANLPDKYRDRVDVQVDVKREIKRIAEELGIPVEQAEAEWRLMEPKLLGRGTGG